jgi:hypothetical protein
MLYLILFLYIVPAIHFYWEFSEEPALVKGYQWMIPVFLWPIMLPFYMITFTLFGDKTDD